MTIRQFTRGPEVEIRHGSNAGQIFRQLQSHNYFWPTLPKLQDNIHDGRDSFTDHGHEDEQQHIRVPPGAQERLCALWDGH